MICEQSTHLVTLDFESRCCTYMLIVVHLNWTAIPFHNNIGSLSSLTFKPYAVDRTLKSKN